MKGRVLVIAGSDSGGGAGIQADIKTITVLGAFAATAITALTAQNTLGVHAVYPVPADFVTRQIKVVLEDIGADCIKIGMLADASIIAAVAAALSSHAAGIPVVLDPVMVAKGGASLLDPAALDRMKRQMVPLASVLTPNLPEAESLTGMRIDDFATMQRAALALLALGAPAVLLKGGHLPGDLIIDLLATQQGIEAFSSPRIESRHTHGTGCTLASALAAGLAQGMDLRAAVIRARFYVQAAIATAPGFGSGFGPLNHAVRLAE